METKRLYRLAGWGGAIALGVVLLVGLGVGWDRLYDWSKPARDVVRPVTNELRGRKTTQDRLDQYGGEVRSRLQPKFERAGIDYSPDEMKLVVFKQSEELVLYARSSGSDWAFIEQYPVLAASGNLGPKRRAGDRQVPEGLYRVSGLNPNSSYHLSIKLNYPNAYDRKIARRQERSDLGDNIFIHGEDVSIGCVAVGNEAIEELFVATALTGKEQVEVLISPVDFRERGDLPRKVRDAPEWVERKYQRLRDELRELPEAEGR